MPVLATHNGRTNSTCLTCHTAGSGGTTTTPPPATAPNIPHAVDAAHQNCLSCHGPSGTVPVTATHNGRTNSTCLTCHTTTSGGTTRPAAPAGLVGTAAAATQVDLTWTDNSSDETGFRIERSTNSAFTGSPVSATVGANTTSYSDTSVSARTTYYYRAYAYNSSGDSAASSSVSVTTPTSDDGGGTPAAPTNLTAVAASGTQVNLSWVDTAINETGYRIERSTSSAFTGVTTFTTAANATAYSDTGVTAGTTYYYRVFATGASGNSTVSNTATVTTPAASVDAAALFSTNCSRCHGANR